MPADRTGLCVARSLAQHLNVNTFTGKRSRNEQDLTVVPRNALPFEVNRLNLNGLQRAQHTWGAERAAAQG
jgi:hypothetical protein